MCFNVPLLASLWCQGGSILNLMFKIKYFREMQNLFLSNDFWVYITCFPDKFLTKTHKKQTIPLSKCVVIRNRRHLAIKSWRVTTFAVWTTLLFFFTPLRLHHALFSIYDQVNEIQYKNLLTCFPGDRHSDSLHCSHAIEIFLQNDGVCVCV